MLEEEDGSAKIFYQEQQLLEDIAEGSSVGLKLRPALVSFPKQTASVPSSQTIVVVKKTRDEICDESRASSVLQLSEQK